MSSNTRCHPRMLGWETILCCSMMAVLAGCGNDDPTAVPFFCEQCRLVNQACWLEEKKCTKKCTNHLDCESGHECIDHDSERACAPYCDSKLCPTNQTCTYLGGGGFCIPAECAENIPCVEPGEACDLFNFKCYPVNGDCSDDDRCPFFNRAMDELGDVECGIDGFCHVQPEPLIQGQPDGRFLPVVAPTIGQKYISQADVVMSWENTGDAAIAYIMTEAPRDRDKALDVAIWGVAVPAGSGSTTTVAQGKAIVRSHWTKDLARLPTKTPLYFFVFTVRHGEIIDFSGYVPFIVGGSWPTHGDPCESSSQLLPACYSPTEVLSCRNGRCNRLCASHADCLGLGSRCAWENMGLRFCE